MDQRIADFITAKHIAIAGVSPRKFGGSIYKTLRKRGYTVYPVHPTREIFHGDRCYARLTDVPAEVEAAVIVVSPDKAPPIVTDAQQAGIDRLWFQQGADFSAAIEKARAAGLQTISGKCILMYAEPVTGIHRLHRFLARLFGRR